MRTKEDMHPYQLHAADHIIVHPSCGLFLDMGLGKTISTLTAINTLMYEELEIGSVLIIAPKRVAESVWDEEIKQWQHVSHLTISKVTGSQKEREAALQAKADIHIIGRDNVAWLCSKYGGSSLPWDMLVIDELSSFKSPKSLRFKTLRRTVSAFKRVVGLTGTPSPNGLIDLWSQLWLLDQGERLGRTLTQYRDTFFNAGARNGMVIYGYDLKKGAKEQIYKRISDICISMKAADYISLPGVTHNLIKLHFDPKQQKGYDDFEREQVLEYFEDQQQGTMISAANAAGLSNKLLQFANGAVYDEHRNVHTIHDLKIKEACELVEEANGKPVLIAYTFQHDCDRLLKALAKHKPVKLSSDQDIKDWNAGKIKVLIMHPASGGHGLNLQHGGNILVWFGQNWSLELYEQLNKRLDRQGQQNKVIIHHLVMSGTIDEEVVKSLTRKADTQNDLMSAVKARIEKCLRSANQTAR